MLLFASSLICIRQKHKIADKIASVNQAFLIMEMKCVYCGGNFNPYIYSLFYFTDFAIEHNTLYYIKLITK